MLLLLIWGIFFSRKVLKEISVGDLNPNETVEANLEAQLLSKLDHPAIVKFYASFVERESFCIITEYCEVRLLVNYSEQIRGSVFLKIGLLEDLVHNIIYLQYHLLFSRHIPNT